MSYGSDRQLSSVDSTSRAYISARNEGLTPSLPKECEQQNSGPDLTYDRGNLAGSSSSLPTSNDNGGLSRPEYGDHRLGDTEVNYQQGKNFRADLYKGETKDNLDGYLSRISQKIYNNTDLLRYTAEDHPTHGRGSPLLSRSPSPPPPPTLPSSSYLDLSMKPSNTSSSSLKKLLILDLNGTLVFRGVKSGNPPHRRVYPRPFMRSFRQYLFCEETRAWLDVMIWSSAQPHNVVDMVDKCFVDSREYLVAIWGRDTLGLRKSEYSRKVQTTKDLDKPWSKLASEENKHHSAASTLLLDDSPAKAYLQPYNHVCLPEYDVTRRRKDVISASAEIARSLLQEKIKGMEESATSHTVDEAEAEVGSSIVPTTNPENVSSSATNELAPPSHPPESKRRHSSSPRESTAEDTKADKKRKKKKSRFGPANINDISESNSRDGTVIAALPFDETLLAVIGILEEARLQSNVAGWIRSGGLWVGHYAAVNELHSTNGNVEERSGSERYSPKKYLPPTDEEDTITFPPSSQTVVETDGEADNESDHSVEKKAQINTGTPSSNVVVAAGNDESTVVEMSPKQQVEESDNAKEGKVKDIQYMEDAKLPLWFENPDIVSYWAKRGREALETLGIPIVHGVRTS